MAHKQLTSWGRAIMKTLIYADLFDYPLQVSEIKQWLIQDSLTPDLEDRKIGNNQISQILRQELKHLCHISDNYICLKNRQKIITQRIKRQQYAEAKIQIANQVSELLKKNPFICLVAITGALAMNNTPANDDIDIMIVAKDKSLWTTRLLTICLLELKGIRRRPHQVNVNNKICANLFLDKTSLALKRSNQDLYMAHEVLQTIPLWSKNHTYEQFLKSNQWVKKYLPFAWEQRLSTASRCELYVSQSQKIWFQPFVDVTEKILYYSQRAYMHHHQTREIVNISAAYFHPKDYRHWVNQAYQSKLKLYKID